MKIYKNGVEANHVRIKQFNNVADTFIFVVDRYYNGKDLSLTTPRLVIEELGYLIGGADLSIETTEDTISVKWVETSNATQTADSYKAQFSWFDTTGYEVYAECFPFVIEKSLKPAGYIPPISDNVWTRYLVKYNELLNETKQKAQESAQSANSSKLYAQESQEWADKSEQSARNNGYVDFYFDEEGNLYMAKTENIEQELDFAIVGDGILEVYMNVN